MWLLKYYLEAPAEMHINKLPVKMGREGAREETAEDTDFPSEEEV